MRRIDEIFNCLVEVVLLERTSQSEKLNRKILKGRTYCSRMSPRRTPPCILESSILRLPSMSVKSVCMARPAATVRRSYSGPDRSSAGTVSEGIHKERDRDEFRTCKVIVFMAVDIIEDRPHIIEIIFGSVV